jgi:SAM-dependent methyltransferase
MSMNNAELQAKYNEMHAEGKKAWFSDGVNERETIITMGIPWRGKRVLEIGCGKGELGMMIDFAGSAEYCGIDYSAVAIDAAKENNYEIENFITYHLGDYRTFPFPHKFDRVVMQGVLEHFDDPWTELAWIIDNLLEPGGDVITSSPCFCNPRGIIWMTLATLFDAPMSLTDLHFLHPWEFRKFAKEHGMRCYFDDTDMSWGNSYGMIDDLRQRLSKVFPDIDPRRIDTLMKWLSMSVSDGRIGEDTGATMVYHLKTTVE